MNLNLNQNFNQLNAKVLKIFNLFTPTFFLNCLRNNKNNHTIFFKNKIQRDTKRLIKYKKFVLGL